MKNKKTENAKDILAMLTVTVLGLVGISAVLGLLYTTMRIWGILLFLFVLLLAWSFHRIARF